MVSLPEQPPLLHTPLYEVHRELGARMVDFGGWLMPIQYRSILAEHAAVRSSAGLFDLSHMGRLSFRGPGALDLVQWLCVNDASRLETGQAQYSLMCDQQGGVLDDVVVYRLADEYLIVVNAGNRLKLLPWIARQRESRGFDARVDDETQALAMVGVQGPRAQERLQPLVDVDLAQVRYYRAGQVRVLETDALVARTGYTGEDGFEVILPAAAAAPLWRRLLEDGSAELAACGLGARDSLRLEAGMHLYGHELTERVNPFEAGLGRVVKLSKAAFVGRDALLRLKEQPPTRKLVGFQMVENGVPRQGYPVLQAEEVVGQVTSGGFAPTLRMNIGLAYVPPHLSEVGQEISIQVRERPLRAEVVALPFYTHRTRRSTGG